MSGSPSIVVEQLYKSLSGKMLSSLVAYFGFDQVEVAEDLVQDTFATALRTWSQAETLPDNPEAWLFKVCKNKALNELENRKIKSRHQSYFLSREKAIAYQLDECFVEDEVRDNQLKVLFTCCAPELSLRNQLIFSLRVLAGMKPADIARALLMKEDAVQKAFTRTRQLFKDKQIYNQGAYLVLSRARLQTVHKVVYLMFNEGYAASSGNGNIKKELCIEAMHLVRLILNYKRVATPDTNALFALMLFHIARFDSRVGVLGEIIDLENQDRAMWDKELIALGLQYLQKSRNGNQVSNFHLEAAIASVHCLAESFPDTDWNQIYLLYNKLLTLAYSPFAELSMHIASAFLYGPDYAIEAILSSEKLKKLQNYYLLNATLGKLYSDAGKWKEAINFYHLAIEQTKVKAEQEYLQQKLEQIKAKERA